MKTWIFVGSGLAALAVINMNRPRAGVERLAQAIAKAEGFGIPGALPTRANNPGDLKMGTVDGRQPINGITVFSTVADGWRALYGQIERIMAGASAHYTPNTTIRQLGQKWTATASEQLAWSRTVAGELGVGLDTPLKAIV